ncbi:N-6 DNA methylase [Streptomyces sp. NBC_01298]|uniref:N-6 DNA methylase n=1 Tax=Streptomyces sp. NBC_01298 TaxID=2903817 RepID=UPI002E104B1C|nr:N-6 DNA methylase [Streptomyces sp. NBC_01298]
MAANAAQEAAALGRAMDALHGVMSVEEAYRLLLLLGLLRHHAESSQSDDARSELFGRYAWDELQSSYEGGHRLYEIVRRGVAEWKEGPGRSRGLSLPDLIAVNPSQLRDVIDAVARAQSPVRLFELVLEAQSRGAKGGQYVTPRDVRALMVDLLAPRPGESVYDPACGSGGLLVESAAYVAARDGKAEGLRLFGQDSRGASLETAAMNLSVHDLEAHLEGPASSLLHDGFPGETFDVVAVNPPFNQARWDHGGRYEGRWPLGVPPEGNANFAWVQRCVDKLSPGGRAGILLPTGAATGTRGAERHIRARLVESDLLAAVVELPAGLIPHVRNPVCLWILSGLGGIRPAHERGKVLLVDARETALTVDKRQRILPQGAVERVVETYASWCGESGASPYEDVPGWSRSVSVEELAAQDFDVLPSRHVPGQVGDAAESDVHQRLEELTAELERHFEDSRRLEDELRFLLGNR